MGWISGDSQIQAAFSQLFGELYSSIGPRSWGNSLNAIQGQITSDQNLSLSKPFSTEKIFLAMKQLGNLKAPDPGGFLGLFYLKNWEVVRENVNIVVSMFIKGNVSMENISKTNIVLIPKVPHLELPSQFRPISLCNGSMTSIKIISKLIANRLKPLPPSLISENQNAFVPDRQIQDNLIIAHEAYHYLKLNKTKKTFEFTLKLDMNKAYDRVE
ncbi:uncharacterized protein LOC126795876 [Argentina anserina]|uniref:uncharacterized protein LOC126795876 n=1 Tax=Argentina anserina TaxID=57926 RepID=UPI00217623F5|nr:uncharacterized protein LOC126795876 [Potentilla anserina]